MKEINPNKLKIGDLIIIKHDNEIHIGKYMPNGNDTLSLWISFSELIFSSTNKQLNVEVIKDGEPNNPFMYNKIYLLKNKAEVEQIIFKYGIENL